MSAIHAFEYLQRDDLELPAMAAVFGGDATLRYWVIERLTGGGELTQFDGDQTEWTQLRDELYAASLFDTDGLRTVALRSADRFLSGRNEQSPGYRAEVEQYAERPSTAARLVLELNSLPSNTRLYRKLSADYLVVAASSRSNGKHGVTAATRRKFLSGYVAGKHQTKLTAGAADALVEMIGEEIGMLDSEIAKLAVYLAPGATIDESLVRDVVAGWQAKTVWQITDAIADGNAAEALRHLDKLIGGGQKPIALLPQISWALRRLGMALAYAEYHERVGRSWKPDEALAAAGFRYPAEIKTARQQLKNLGRDRGRQLLPWLLDADLRLKGSHSTEGQDRFLLENLVIKLARR
jgi:DNA polymerase-3 subunit delta